MASNVKTILLYVCLAVITAMVVFSSDSKVVENFLPHMTVKTYSSVDAPASGSCSAKSFALPGWSANTLAGGTNAGSGLGPLSDNQFIKTTNLQSMVAPRMDNAMYSATVRFNMPPTSVRAADPAYPIVNTNNSQCTDSGMNFGDGGEDDSEDYSSSNRRVISRRPGSQRRAGTKVVYKRENFAPNCDSQGYGMSGAGQAGGSPMPGYTNGDFGDALQKASEQNMAPGMNAIGSLPMGDMTALAGDGAMANPVIRNNIMVANARSRLRNHGDQIRGDLPIAPCKPGWFSPSVSPSVDLSRGALNVMAGNDNATALALATLVNASAGGVNMPSGGVANALAGVPSSSLPSYAGELSQLGSTLQLSSMPL